MAWIVLFLHESWILDFGLSEVKTSVARKWDCFHLFPPLEFTIQLPEHCEWLIQSCVALNYAVFRCVTLPKCWMEIRMCYERSASAKTYLIDTSTKVTTVPVSNFNDSEIVQKTLFVMRVNERHQQYTLHITLFHAARNLFHEFSHLRIVLFVL